MANSDFTRLKAAYRTVAELVIYDPIFISIFERIEAELAALEISGDVVSRARAIAMRYKSAA